MSNYRRQLTDELRGEGASKQEAAALSDLAMSLAHLATSETPSSSVGRWPVRVGWLSAGFATGVIGCMVLAATSLSSLPGTWNHPVKSTMEAVAVKIDPALATSVMMDKSWEVAQLSTSHQSPQLVLATVRDYNAYVAKLTTGDHYAAWGYCSRELKAAAQNERGDVRQAIEQSYAQIPQDQS